MTGLESKTSPIAVDTPIMSTVLGFLTSCQAKLLEGNLTHRTAPNIRNNRRRPWPSLAPVRGCILLETKLDKIFGSIRGCADSYL
jgi:hypothetical protein